MPARGGRAGYSSRELIDDSEKKPESPVYLHQNDVRQVGVGGQAYSYQSQPHGLSRSVLFPNFLGRNSQITFPPHPF
jgi:hypothetical protein